MSFVFPRRKSQGNYQLIRELAHKNRKNKILFYYEAVNQEGAFDLRVTEMKR